MAPPKKKKPTKKAVETLTHGDATRTNIPTAEYEAVMRKGDHQPASATYERPGVAASAAMESETETRNPDLDPQLVWRGKDTATWSDLVVQAPPLFIQEKVHPKALIDDLRRRTEAAEIAKKVARGGAEPGETLDLFADFNGIPDHSDAKTEFYQHDQHWTNRMILGDSLQVMASLAEREGLRGKVQCIYLDPPYGIKFNSNFQWSTTSRDVKDGKSDHITREPEQVKAFRDTWRDGIHSYLTYLRDRLTAARDLLHDTGSIFVQIGDENVHRVRAVMDEVFGDENFIITITFQKKAYQDAREVAPVADFILWAAKDKTRVKYRPLLMPTPFTGDVGKYSRLESPELEEIGSKGLDEAELQEKMARRWELLRNDYPIVSQDPPSAPQPIEFNGRIYHPPRNRHWSQTWPDGMERLAKANRIRGTDARLYAREYWRDSPSVPRNNLWLQLKGPSSPTYVVETATVPVQRCLLMATDPGDLVLDPTCGSGTTAYVAEQWGRRWITIDTSRVSLALARARIMGARYPFYLLADSPEGRKKEAAVSGRDVTDTEDSRLRHDDGRDARPTITHGSVRQGFVYERVPHITLKSIANNAEIDVIYENYRARMEPVRAALNALLDTSWQEWEVPRVLPERCKASADAATTSSEGLETSSGGAKSSSDGLESSSSGLKSSSDGLKSSSDGLKSSSDGLKSSLDGLKSSSDGLESSSTGLKSSSDGLESSSDGLEFSLEVGDTSPEELHSRWWALRIARQREIDASIAARADSEYLYDKPYEDKKKVRVAGPFTVESLSPHRTLGVDENDELIDPLEQARRHAGTEARSGEMGDPFLRMVLENLKTAGVQQSSKADKITFTSITPYPGEWIGAEGRYVEEGAGDQGSGTGQDKSDAEPEPRSPIPDPPAERRAGIFIGPEFGTVSRQDLVVAAREAAEADFDVLIACAFNYEAHASEFSKLGGLPILKARMNADLHMADDLKNTGKGNLFVIFGEPDIDLLPPEDADQKASLTEFETMRVRVNGVDVFNPSTGEVRSDDADGIACWFIDTDYNEESFFVRHAYFLGASDPYKSLKTTLKAEIDREAWETLHSDTSREFPKPRGGRIAVKVINHLGDEVMKVFRVE